MMTLFSPEKGSESNNSSDYRLHTYPDYIATSRDVSLPILQTHHPRFIMEPLKRGIQQNPTNLRTEVAAMEKAYMEGVSSDFDFENESVGFISCDGEAEETEDEISSLVGCAFDNPIHEEEDTMLADREWWRQQVRRF